MSESARRKASLDDFWSIPEAIRFHELIAGELIEKAAPSGEHGSAQAGIVGAVHAPFQRPLGRGGPGGWWIATEVEVLLEAEVAPRRRRLASRTVSRTPHRHPDQGAARLGL